LGKFRGESNSLWNADQQRFFYCELACYSQMEPTTVAGMRTFIKISSLFFALLVTMTLSVVGGTSEKEKAFTDKYKKAFEAKDTATMSPSFTHKGQTQRRSSFTK